MNKSFFVLFLLFFLLSVSARAQYTAQRTAVNPGITPYISYKGYLKQKKVFLTSPFVKNIYIIFHWKDLEPSPAGFVFEEAIGSILKETKEAGIGVAFMIWVGPNSPDWIYENGVPLVRVTGGPDWSYPYYFSEPYQKYLNRFIQAFGKYMRGLPSDALKRILFLQVAEGSTGDTGPYQGASKPINEAFEIERATWMEYRMQVWEDYRAALWKGNRTVVPLVFTDDANTDKERNWQLSNLPEFGVKKGQFAHGYNNNFFLRLMQPWQTLQHQARQRNILLFARGEFDNILLNQGWVKANPGLVFYWSALSAVFHDINYWNPSIFIIKDPETFSSGLDLYNTYVQSLGNPSDAPYAFCAMRRMLDASDTLTFPEQIYGKASRRNTERFYKILSEFESKGALIGDSSKLGAGPILSRTRKKDNDIGWNVYRGNFFKHLKQLEPESTSEAYWNLDTTTYGRFARTFKKDAQSRIYFSLERPFFHTGKPQEVNISITYKDQGHGSWTLLYYDGEKMKSTGTVINQGRNEWMKKEFNLKDAVFLGKLDKGADLILERIEGENTFFHMIELKRTR